MEIVYGPPSWIEWSGSHWSLQKDGYYKDKTGSLFHVCLWEHANQRRLGPNEIIHHIDHNRRNNDLSNLTLMSRADHVRHHKEERGFTWPESSRGVGVRKMWANRQPRDCVC